MSYGPGVMPSQKIREMILNRVIIGDFPILDSQVQPASLDSTTFQ